MTTPAALKDLLDYMREHPAFPMLLDQLNPKPLILYSDQSEASAEKQTSDWIFRSGRHRQHLLWREFLTKYVPSVPGESQPSQQE